MMMIWALLRVRIVAIWHHDHHFVRLFLLSSSGSRIRGVPRRFVRARPNVVVVVSKRKKMNHVAKWEMIIKKSVLSSSIERTRERERKRWSQRGEFPRLWEKSQFLRSKTTPSSLKFMWITLLPFLRHRPTKASSSFVPEALSFVIVRSAVFWARFRILRGRRYLLVAFSSVSVTRHHLCISLFLKSYSSALYIIHRGQKDDLMNFAFKKRKERARSFALFKQQQHLCERDKAAANTIAFAFARLLSEWWILICVVL